MNNDWNPKVIMVQSICDFARVLMPCQPDWSKQPIYIIALRLSDIQYRKLQLLGCKSVAKMEPTTGIVRYNFKRNTLSKGGLPLPPLPVVALDGKVWPVSKLIGNGSEVVTALEYGEHPSGEGYTAGVSFRIGAIQVINYVPFVEHEIPVDLSILEKFTYSQIPTTDVPENKPTVRIQPDQQHQYKTGIPAGQTSVETFVPSSPKTERQSVEGEYFGENTEII